MEGGGESGKERGGKREREREEVRLSRQTIICHNYMHM